ncbi:hypothetical protein AAVH_03384 [Aphelenchoides avenae]|nr:hypothetical protein AAVH_03384 [Aphelenchus avenae]
MEAACYSTTEAVFAATEQSSLDADMNNLSASARSALARERLLNTNMDPHDIGEPSRGSSSASHASTSHNTPSLLELNIGNQWNGIPVQTRWVSTYVDKDWRYLKFPGAHGVYAFQFVSDRAVRSALNVVNVGGGQKYTPYMVPYWCVKCKVLFPVGVFSKQRHLQLDPDRIIEQGDSRHSQLCVRTEGELASLSTSRKRRMTSDSLPASNSNTTPRADYQPPIRAPRTTQQSNAEETAAFISTMLPHLATTNMQITLKCEGFVKECVIGPSKDAELNRHRQN